ncbi:MAG: hypothetical protein KDB03_02050 [Planctomycetales bacterium]|nr:hypothetical protein [Planctomycetales bacterium]
MTPDAGFYPFSKEVWQAVNTQAMNALARREYCREKSQIESVRCVHLEDETEDSFGRQVWFFEAFGVDPVGRNHRLYGALDFTVQYGILEPARAALVDEPQHRNRFLLSVIRPSHQQIWGAPSTNVWVRLTLAFVLFATAIWMLFLWVSLVG